MMHMRVYSLLIFNDIYIFDCFMCFLFSRLAIAICIFNGTVPEAHQLTRQSGEQVVAETIGGEALEGLQNVTF